MKQETEIALIAKELGLKSDLITPSGQGLKLELKRICEDLNGVGKKLSDHITQDSEVTRSVQSQEEKLGTLDTRLSALEKEMKDNISHRTVKKLWLYVQKTWKVTKPILYLAGVGMIYFIAKSLGIPINI